MATDTIQFVNLPGVFARMEENGLASPLPLLGERTLVLGTSSKGRSGLYVASNSTTTASEFGTSTLVRGMYETAQGGAPLIILYRLGATAAKLQHIGDSLGVEGYTIQTYRLDDDAGTVYTVYYDDTTDHLVVFNALTGLVVYDNEPSPVLDRGEVIVAGSRAIAGGPDIGLLSSGTPMAEVVAAGTIYTPGTDGTNPSRMKLYEFLDIAYRALVVERFDYIVPMDIYLDDKNIVDGDSFSSAYITAITDGDDYPTAGSSDDILGKLYIETYHGKRYYFWDLNGDGHAELYPAGIGHASSTLKISGESLDIADFHEVNFAYQLAWFSHRVSVNNNIALGSIGVRPPESYLPEDIAVWLGDAPTFTTQDDGTRKINSIADNGNGLLGNKFHGGNFSWRGGLAYGGMPLTDGEFPDGIEVEDDNGYPIDLGRYLSTIAAFGQLYNPAEPTGRGYVTTLAPLYMGFVASLDEQQAPTNQIINSVHKVFNLEVDQVDTLAGLGYVFFFEKPRGMTISDSPSSAMPTSDYRRLTTMRIVKRCMKVVRTAANPFLGKSFNDGRKQACQNAIDSALDKLLVAGYIKRKEAFLTQTPRQATVGEARLELLLVPAFELRRITTFINLRPT